ncbi:hypothetical protein BTHE68_62890 (plasmid) [Burkholderia sp. THE68]|uniref:DUF4148 domain-containing protein n=1 Tax=Burkholderia sp. THE68 TaxID=758782 RepID=UPI00131643E4|nr:DUF4148 domain-containing protein [Burkholderia sp. THE68]BBU32555.1 hypothetical protein BTHE68_62890 [Burkholderia sp. THE68]
MKFSKLNAVVVWAVATFGLVAVPGFQARAANGDNAASGAAMSKQELKAQKKADRQARRAKKNAELSTLEKNGYNPGGDQTNYPQNLQNAQQKAAGQKPTNAPAVAP